MKHLTSHNKHGYCGIATVINLLRHEDLMPYLEFEEAYAMTNITLNKILEREGYNTRVLDIVTMFGDVEIPNDFVIKVISADYLKGEYNFTYPLLIFYLTVQLGFEDETHHAIGLIRHKNDYYLSDNRNDRYVKLSGISDLFNSVRYVSQISTFGIIKDNQYMMAEIDGEEYGFKDLLTE